ncbi:MAG: NAD(P)-binding protein [Candidatus Aenigmarchaeota archaeon]|nr:NAD(P)-binding protein [Candidatus Aenigmarchaeota archaeon]
MHDIAIVGAGASGLYLASLLEKEFDVVVIEEHKQAGGKACSGLYSANIEKFVDINESWIEHAVEGAVLHSPNSTEVKVTKGKTAAYVMNRDLFDRHLASGLSCPLKFDTRVEKIKIGNHVKLLTDKGIFESRMVIGADGANSAVRRHFKTSPKEIVNGIIAITNQQDCSKNVDLWFNKKLISDGFFWKIPRGKRTEYGALGRNINYNMLESFFRLRDYKKHAAFIPIGPCKSYFDRCLLIGDAAGITKPWSGGGVLYAFNCAKIAKNVIKTAFDRNDFSERVLKSYEGQWKTKLGINIALGLVAREALKSMADRDIDSLFAKFNEKKMSRLDMDFPFADIG